MTAMLLEKKFFLDSSAVTIIWLNISLNFLFWPRFLVLPVLYLQKDY